MHSDSQWIRPSRSPHEVEKYPLLPKIPAKSKVTTLTDLFPYVDQFALGFQETFNLLSTYATTKPATYPPCDILKDGDSYEIQIALAGFKKSDIKIEVQDLKLTVSSSVVKEEEVLISP